MGALPDYAFADSGASLRTTREGRAGVAFAFDVFVVS
jgi:hypothetical protein